MKPILGIAFLLILLAYGCDDDYYTDGGILDDTIGELGTSTMDYLENYSTEFDTLVALIKICKLEAEVDEIGNTFFAPRDYSIHNYFELIFADLAEWPASLAEIDPDDLVEIADILQNYIIPNHMIKRDSLSTAYSYKTTLGNKSARFNIVQDDYLDNVNAGAKYIKFSLNVSDNVDYTQYQSVDVLSSDLVSTNGIIHVLESNSHIFGFH